MRPTDTMGYNGTVRIGRVPARIVHAGAPLWVPLSARGGLCTD
jgi:hypothetical protein